MKLRPYQEEAITTVWANMVKGSKTSLVVLPPGAGKSIIFSELIAKSISVKPDIKVCVLFNRVDLLDQQTERMKSYLKKDIVGQWCGSLNKHDDKQILMSSVQSIYDEDHYFDLIIIDETHGVDDKAGKYFSFIAEKLKKNPKTKIVGFTATPYRYDGYIYGKNRLFDSVTFNKPIEWFIDNGFLVPLVSKQPDFVFDTSKLKIVAGEYSQASVDKLVNGNENFVRQQIADCLARSYGRSKMVWQCANIDHAELVNNLLRKSGEESTTVHSNLSRLDRDYNLEQFEYGGVRHMTFVSIVSEGYDYPPIDCIVLMRPTRSAAMYVQTAGRGLRPSEGKSDCLVLDYADVVKSLGPVSDPIIERKSKGKGKDEPAVKVCNNCRTHNKLGASACSVCDTPFERPKPPIDKLNKTADETGGLLGRKPDKVMEIGKVVHSEYTSKSGNQCYVIDYQPKGFNFSYGSTGVKEYFVKDNPWAIVKYQKRMIELKMNPTHISYSMDGKYPRVERLIFKGNI